MSEPVIFYGRLAKDSILTLLHASLRTDNHSDSSSRMIPIVMPSPSSPSTFKFSLALALSIRRRRATSLRGPPLSFNAQTVLTPLGRCQEAHWDGLVVCRLFTHLIDQPLKSASRAVTSSAGCAFFHQKHHQISSMIHPTTLSNTNISDPAHLRHNWH